MDQPIDHSLAVREAVVAHLKANAALILLVSANSIHGEQPPAGEKLKWPFIRYGLPISGPWAATGWRGSTHRVTLHAFSHGPFTDAINKISAAVVNAMQGLVLPTLDLVDLQWVGTQVVRDTDEANAYHAICEFDLIAVLSV